MPDVGIGDVDVDLIVDVIVVGGGIAGMVVARDLARAGLMVTIVEASARLGGKVASHTVGGLVLDSGAESFATRRDTVATLARELGLGDELITPNQSGAWLQSATGEARPLPKTGILGIPGTPMARDVIDAIGLLGAFRAQLDSLLPGIIGSGEQHLGPLVRKRMGRRVLERLVTPVARGIHSRHPDELDVDTVAPGLRSAVKQQESLAQAVLALRAAAPAGSPVAGIRGGIHRLADSLHRELVAAGVELRLNSPVTSADAAGVSIEGGERVAARRVVMTTVPDQKTGTPISLATLVVNAPELDSAPRGTGLLVADGAPGIRAKALTHATAKWAWLAEQAGPHRHVLRLSYDGTRVGTDDLAEIARADAQKLLGIGIPASSVIDYARVDWTAPAMGKPTAPDGVLLTGEAVSGTGLTAVIGHARQAAAQILSSFEILSSFTETTERSEDDGDHDAEPPRKPLR